MVDAWATYCIGCETEIQIIGISEPVVDGGAGVVCRTLESDGPLDTYLEFGMCNECLARLSERIRRGTCLAMTAVEPYQP